MAWFKTREEVVEMTELDASLLSEESKIDAGGKSIKKVALVTPPNGPQAIMDLAFFHKKYVETKAPRATPTPPAEATENATPKRERKSKERKALGTSPLSPEPNGQAAEA